MVCNEIQNYKHVSMVAFQSIPVIVKASYQFLVLSLQILRSISFWYTLAAAAISGFLKIQIQLAGPLSSENCFHSSHLIHNKLSLTEISKRLTI